MTKDFVLFCAKKQRTTSKSRVTKASQRFGDSRAFFLELLHGNLIFPRHHHKLPDLPSATMNVVKSNTLNQ